MRNHRSFIVLIASAMPWATATVAAAPAPVTWEELRRLPKDCPVIYDNDWLRDTNDDEYLLAKAHLGQANLKGYILSKDEWDHGRQYKTEDGRRDFEHDLAIARRAGFRNVPELTIGADRLLERPASGMVEDAKPVASAGTDLIVREARQASPRKAAGHHRRGAALHRRQRIPGRPVDRRSHGGDDDRHRWLQRLGPVGQLRRGHPLQARELRGQPALVAAVPRSADHAAGPVRLAAGPGDHPIHEGGRPAVLGPEHPPGEARSGRRLRRRGRDLPPLPARDVEGRQEGEGHGGLVARGRPGGVLPLSRCHRNRPPVHDRGVLRHAGEGPGWTRRSDGGADAPSGGGIAGSSRYPDPLPPGPGMLRNPGCRGR